MTAIQTVIYPVKDLDAAKAVFGALLGAEPVMDAPYYVQYAAGGLEIGLDPNGHGKGMTGPVCYWRVDDIRASVARLREAGATESEPVTDVGGGRLVAVLADTNGNPVGLMQTP